MNDDAANNATNQPVTLENEDTPGFAVFAAANPAATAAAVDATTIAPDSHFLSHGIKLDTELFSKGNIKNMADKDKFDVSPDPDLPNADTPDASAQDSGSTDSNYPYSFINSKFLP